jgi:hypothetical protein
VKIAITSLGNPDQTRLATRRDLPGHKAGTSSKVSSAGKRLAFADRRGESRRVQHADDGDSRQTPGCLIGLRARRKLIIEGSDASIKISPFLPYVLAQVAQSRADCENVLFEPIRASKRTT